MGVSRMWGYFDICPNCKREMIKHIEKKWTNSGVNIHTEISGTCNCGYTFYENKEETMGEVKEIKNKE